MSMMMNRVTMNRVMMNHRDEFILMCCCQMNGINPKTVQAVDVLLKGRGSVALISVILAIALKPSPKYLLKKETLIRRYQRSTSKKERFKLFWQLYIRNAQGRRIGALAVGFLVVNAMNFAALHLDPTSLGGHVESGYDLETRTSWSKEIRMSRKAVLKGFAVEESALAMVILFQTIINLHVGSGTLTKMRARAIDLGMTSKEAEKMKRDDLVKWITIKEYVK